MWRVACVLPVLLLVLPACARLTQIWAPAPVVVEPRAIPWGALPEAGVVETDRALSIMNLTVTFCGFQPDQADVEAMMIANPARTSESTAAAICSAMAPRVAIRRGWILPQVDGVPVRGRFVRR